MILLDTIVYLISVIAVFLVGRFIKRNELASRNLTTFIKYGAIFIITIYFANTLLMHFEATASSTKAVVKWLNELYSTLIKNFDVVLFRLGEEDFTLLSLIRIVLLIFFIVILSTAFRRFLRRKVLSKTSLDYGVQHAISSVSSYVFALIGILIVIQTSGIDLSALTFLAGAVGIGVGFGLQNIANNFISGLVILLERPIKIGDRIEVNGIDGNVDKISGRATTVITNDNIAIIIPNADLISKNVINWSYTDRKVRFRVPIGVSYESDVDLVKQILLEIADENPNVLPNPTPNVYFTEFGDSSLNFSLIVWTSKMLETKPQFVSQLNFAIWRKFKENNIIIPFPQRDLHLKSSDVIINSKS